jgi:signal transduction histidine kinase
MASSEILLIAVGSELLALYGPKFDLFVIVCVVLLADFVAESRLSSQPLHSASSGWVLSQPDMDPLKSSRGTASSQQQSAQSGVAHWLQEDPSKRRVTVESEIGEELPRISVDPIQVQEVLINLITDAIEAMEGSARDPRLIIRAAADRREMSIQVIDNGPGLDDPENIFEPFISTKKKGMGIGLAVSRSIVEAHEGQLWAENNPDFGARFTLKLPLAKRAQ